MIVDYMLTYLGIGVIIYILSDISIREMKTSEPFTFIEIVSCVLFWPFVVFAFIREFFNGDY